jgi:hypothetical protein
LAKQRIGVAFKQIRVIGGRELPLAMMSAGMRRFNDGGRPPNAHKTGVFRAI